MATLEESVQSGIGLLDQKRPGWWKGIDLGKLRMTLCTSCVLGQIYGGFEKALDSLGLDNGREHGFSGRLGSYPDDKDDYPILNSLWATEIRKRQEATRE